MEYEALLKYADTIGLTTKEFDLKSSNGRINGNRIAIKKDLLTVEKTCTLAEELGHYHTSSGDILDQESLDARKQEIHARTWSYDLLIGLDGIIDCYNHRCMSVYDMAQYLEVTEEIVIDSLERYKQIYGICTVYQNKYIIYFEPLGIFRLTRN